MKHEAKGDRVRIFLSGKGVDIDKVITV